MKSHTPELIALLNSSTQFVMADLFTFTLASGIVLRYTSADIDIPYAGSIYSARGPLFKRGQVRTVLGLEVDTLDITVYASVNDDTHLLSGLPFIPAALQGALDGASVELRRAFMSDWSQPPVGAVVLFSGRVSDMSGKRSELNFNVKSDLELLNTKLPRNIYQAGCLHTLYDTGCGASKTSRLVSASVASSEGAGRLINTYLPHPTGWFDQGVLTFTSGPNAGVQRTVKSFNGGVFHFALPLPNTSVAGDGFQVYPGCDKTQGTCQSKFNNLARFRGFPYVPAPETTT